ncbi:MAG: hypothetical protein R2705_05500 [Ilumatobacteraceae bacterium]
MGHKARDGEPVPGTFADTDELNAIADALVAAGGGLFEVAPEVFPGDPTAPTQGLMDELKWMGELSERTGLKVTYLLLQYASMPGLYRDALTYSRELLERGVYVRPGCGPPVRDHDRLDQLSPVHQASDLPADRGGVRCRHRRARGALADPAVKAAILSETDLPVDPTIPFDGMPELLVASLGVIYANAADEQDPNVDYEPTADRTVVAIAEGVGSIRSVHLRPDDGTGWHRVLDVPVAQLRRRQPRRDLRDAHRSRRHQAVSPTVGRMSG